MLAKEQKKSLIDQYGTHASDTGSPEVQIALLSERIGQLTQHFKTHQKDHGSRRGLLMLVSKRRSLLDYLKKYDTERYKAVIGKLGIRKYRVALGPFRQPFAGPTSNLILGARAFLSSRLW